MFHNFMGLFGASLNLVQQFAFGGRELWGSLLLNRGGGLLGHDPYLSAIIVS